MVLSSCLLASPLWSMVPHASQHAERGINTPSPSYRLGRGDAVKLQVFNAPELTAVARIHQGGRAILPVLGPLRLAGKTLEQARLQIQRRLAEVYLRHPQVALTIVHYASQPVTILGAVKRPGIYALRRHRDLFSLLAQAGGLLPNATTIWITRGGKISARLRAAASGSPLNDPLLRPYDVVQVGVPSFVYIGGQVHHPGAYAYPAAGLTLLEALSLAGGVRADAVVNRSRWVRLGAHGQRQTRRLRLGPVLDGRAADPVLRPNDLVYIPSSLGRVTLIHGLRTALAAGVTIVTGVIIFH
jgi:polysaccharide export outer membrane protein